MMKKILVVCPNPSIDTYAWVDHFEMGVPNRITREDRYPGGKGLHVAMALSELGIPVAVAGFWGGETGAWIQKACNRYYPNVSFIGPSVEEWSRICYTFKAAGDFDDTEILATGPTIDATDFNELMTAVNAEIDQCSMVAMCGSWPKGSPEDGYKQITLLAKQQGINSYIDCTGIQLRNALAAHPYGIHLNRKEVSEFFETDFETAKAKILEYCEEAAITDGSKGLHLLTNTSDHHALATIDHVISTIGSGDCLVAGILAGHFQELDQQNIANMGAACGAANCLKEELGMLNKDDVLSLLKKMES